MSKVQVSVIHGLGGFGLSNLDTLNRDVLGPNALRTYLVCSWIFCWQTHAPAFFSRRPRQDVPAFKPC